MGHSNPGFGLYVHWPFCLSKCPYCDFNSHVVSGVDHSEWQRALLSELDYFGTETTGRRLTSVFFGGGTPSLMAPPTIAAILDKIGDYWELDDALEITLEANPTSIEAAKFRDFKTAGINRVSVGVQSLNDDSLKFLGREHSAREARTALSVASSIFDRYSFDLIYALSGQSMESWQLELSEALEMAGEHLSLYQLTIESGTPFFRDGVDTLNDDLAADMFELTQSLMESAHRPAYEISNHATIGSECRHNLTYWLGGDYIGIGPGAHGRITSNNISTATHQIHNPQRWIEVVNTQCQGTAKRRILSAENRAQELVMMGLRLTKGFNLLSIPGQTSLAVSEVIDQEGQRRMTEGGFIKVVNNQMIATSSGKLCLNGVIKHLLT